MIFTRMFKKEWKLIVAGECDFWDLENYLLDELGEDNPNEDIVRLLVALGADIHVDRDYPVQLACRSGNLGIVKFLVENGSDLSTDNRLAFRMAESRLHQDVIDYLMEIENSAKVIS